MQILKMNIRTGLLSLFAAALLAPSALQAHCGACGMEDDHGKKEMKMKGHKHAMHGHKSCPMHVDGSKVKIENTEDGVVIRITAADKDAVAAIQKGAKKMEARKCCGDKMDKKKKKGKREKPRRN